MRIAEDNIKWREFKQGILSLWDLSEAEIEACQRDTDKLETIIISKYIHANPKMIHKQMLQLIDSFNNPTDRDSHKLYQTSFERRPPIPEVHP